MKLNKYFSYNKGRLPKGCRLCVKGQKLVLFVTGICPRHCYFCPISDLKYQKDVIYANERNVKKLDEVVAEAKAMDAKGAGITGGDPLARLERSIYFIKGLKKRFGKKFHIHLYTSLDLVTRKKLEKLYKAGLDEIRFHLDIGSEKLWDRLLLALPYKWDAGIEAPLVPGKEKMLKKIIDRFHDKAGFINLNELEMADNEHSYLPKMGFKTKSRMSYAVKGSLEMGKRLLGYAANKVPVHLCTAKLKDKVQLGNRIKREARHSKKSFDIVDDEGMLIRGALYLKELAPGAFYRKRLKRIDRKIIQKLKSFKIKNAEIDYSKGRIILSAKDAIKNKDKFIKMGLRPAIVREYPTADQLEMEVEFLG